MQFKDRIKQLREEKGLDITKLAAEFSMKEAGVRAWELGRTKPGADTLVKLAKYFNCTIDYLLGISNVRTEGELKKRDAEIDTFVEKFNEVSSSTFDILVSQITKICTEVDAEAAKYVLFNIALVTGFHLEITNEYNRRLEIAKSADVRIHDLSEKGIEVEKIGVPEALYLTQREVYHAGRAEAERVKNVTIDMVDKLFELICKQNGLHAVYGERYDKINNYHYSLREGKILDLAAPKVESHFKNIEEYYNVLSLIFSEDKKKKNTQSK